MSSRNNPLRELVRLGLGGERNRIAAIFPQKKLVLSVGHLSERIAAVRSLLEIRPRPNRMILFLAKSPEYLEWLLTGFDLGICVCPMDVTYGETELQQAVYLFKPDLIVSQASLKKSDFFETHSADGMFLHRSIEKPAAHASIVNNAALCLFTSGTTGKPKGVLLSSENLAYSASLPALAHGITLQDRVLAVLPLTMINGLVTTVLTVLHSRSSAIYYEGLFTPYQAFRWALEHEATWFNAVPLHYAAFCNPPLEEDDIKGHQLRFCRSAGSRLPVEVLKNFEKYYRIPIIETMGLTETAGQVFANPMDGGARRLGSVGMPVGVEAKIMSAGGKQLPDGQEGEIWLKGENVFMGYLDDPESTSHAVEEGWLRTGDIGRRSSDGFFSVTGRIKEIVIRGGQNVSLQEVDDTLCQHAAVAVSGSIGLETDLEGEMVVSFVQPRLKARIGEKELLAHCRERLADFKIPSKIAILTELPLRSNGKVDKQELRKMARRFKDRG